MIKRIGIAILICIVLGITFPVHSQYSQSGRLGGKIDPANPPAWGTSTPNTGAFSAITIGTTLLAPSEILVPATGSLTAPQMGGGLANNYGQTVANTQTLPACAANLRKTFIAGTSGMGALNIKPAGSDIMILDGATLTAAHKASDATPAVGDYLSCYSFQTGATAWEWICATGSGTWTDGGL